MELLMILTYAAICFAIFKIFRIPVNKWTLPTAVLGGIFLIGVILLIMNYNHPFSANARIYFATTPIMPAVKGRVIEVPVKANAPLKQGDVLFKIDPRPYQYQVDQRKALLAEAEQNVKQLKAAYDQALANAEGQCPDDARAGRVRPAEISVREERDRPSSTRCGDTQPRCREASLSGGRGGYRRLAARLRVPRSAG